MRSSDWSSDVCSSDLPCASRATAPPVPYFMSTSNALPPDVFIASSCVRRLGRANQSASASSEERRVGKECVSTCRSSWSTCHSQYKIHKYVDNILIQRTNYHMHTVTPRVDSQL